MAIVSINAPDFIKHAREQQSTDQVVSVKPFGFWTNCACSLAEKALGRAT